MTLKLVLDTSAAVAFCTDGPRAVAVGETIREVVDEGARFGILALSLAEALNEVHRTESARLLDVLTTNPACEVMSLTDNWRALALAASVCHGMSQGAAWQAAATEDAYLLTAEPDSYGGPESPGVIAVD